MRLILLLLLAILPAELSAQDTLIAPRAKGNAKAPVTVYEMSDFQCPYCREFTLKTYPSLEKEYVTTGKVRWVFINNPLSMHPNAPAAAEFAMCAAKQGKFWPAHDMLYARQEQWNKLKEPGVFFATQMQSLGIKSAPMVECLKNGAGKTMVASDIAGAKRSGADGTPNFYIEGGMMVGLHPMETWRKVLDSLVKVKSVKKP